MFVRRVDRFQPWNPPACHRPTGSIFKWFYIVCASPWSACFYLCFQMFSLEGYRLWSIWQLHWFAGHMMTRVMLQMHSVYTNQNGRVPWRHEERQSHCKRGRVIGFHSTTASWRTLCLSNLYVLHKVYSRQTSGGDGDTDIKEERARWGRFVRVMRCLLKTQCKWTVEPKTQRKHE